MIYLNKLVNVIDHKKLLFLLFCITIFFLIFDTGFVSDDFSEINNIKKKQNFNPFLPFNTYINIPVLYYTHYIFFYFVSIDNYIYISLIKFFYTLISFYMISKFFNIFSSYHTSLLTSFLFIFWPTHDATVYFFLAQYLMLTVAFQFYAYYLLSKNCFITAIIFSLLGSFISYGSSPIAFALATLFILNKSYKKSILIILPNIIYIIYYIFVSKIFYISSISRIPNSFDWLNLVKNYIFQIITLIDVNIGISFVLKLYYSILENNLVSLFFSIIFFILYLILKKKSDQGFVKLNLDFKLLIALTLIIFISLLMFSVTGGYYQNGFNLGNRVSIYSALIFSYLFVFLTNNKKIHLFSILFIAIIIFGISNHWKKATINQNKIIENIGRNQELKNYNLNKVLFITGSDYSKFGKFSHIEFFSASHVAESIFSLKNLNHLTVKTLNNNFKFDGEYLIDQKFQNRKFFVDNDIVTYDTKTNLINVVNNNEINYYIDSLERNNRHWIQLQKNHYIGKIISKHFPSLDYLF